MLGGIFSGLGDGDPWIHSHSTFTGLLVVGSLIASALPK